MSGLIQIGPTVEKRRSSRAPDPDLPPRRELLEARYGALLECVSRRIEGDRCPKVAWTWDIIKSSVAYVRIPAIVITQIGPS